MKVKCIWGKDPLIKGQVYEVKRQDDIYYYVVDQQGLPVDERGGGWYKERFEVVEEPTTTHKYDGKECPCGMPSDQCDYHRGT